MTGLAACCLSPSAPPWWHSASARMPCARQTALSRQLATQALALADTDPGTAMSLSVEAYRTRTNGRGAAAPC